MVELRDATQADAHAIANVLVQSWRAAYRGLLPDDVLAGLSIPDPGTVLVGRPHRPPAAHPRGRRNDRRRHRRLRRDRSAARTRRPRRPHRYALYLAPDRWRRGIGTQLHAAALDRLRSCGFTHAGLWVLDTNERALRFYHRHGWTDTGRSQLDHGPGGTELHERRLHRDLSD